jgi:hypothetical protein
MVARQPENIIEMLTADYEKVRDLLRRYDATSDQHTRGQLAEQVCLELILHTRLEETIFYPFRSGDRRRGEAAGC